MVGADCAIAGAATAVVPASTRPDFKTSRRFMVVLPRLSRRILQGPRQLNRGYCRPILPPGKTVARFIGIWRAFRPGAMRECSVRRHAKPERLRTDQPQEIALAAP